MIDAKELMVGDWVLGLVEDKVEPGKVIAKHPAKVVKIEENGDISAQCPYVFDEMYESDGSLIDDFCWYDIEPMPLTEEILEKNGFIKKEEKTLDLDLGFCMLYGEYRRIEEKILGGKMINYGDSLYPIRYVHQFQNALRLCEIDKEIII